MKNNTPMGRLSLGMLPTTPIPFSDPQFGWVAWTRVIAYGGIAAMTFGKARKVSYFALGAAGLCLATSLSSEAMGKIDELSPPQPKEINDAGT